MTTSPEAGDRSWTVAVRERVSGLVPPGQLLPDRQPEYVRSWIYVFGVASLASLVYVIASGLVLTLKGVSWWHESSVGHFVNSTHLWSVELFFFFMVIHLWGKFFMAAWRGRRALTWITGAVAFVGSIGAAFTGYLTGQLRLTVDLHAGQGWSQLGGHRRRVQRSRHRPNAAMACDAVAARALRPRRTPRHPGPQTRSRAAVRSSTEPD